MRTTNIVFLTTLVTAAAVSAFPDAKNQTREYYNVEMGTGGDGGDPFCDNLYEPVTGFVVHHGSRIDSVQFKYGLTWGDSHGGGGGEQEIAELGEDRIVEISGRSKSEIDGLSFRTLSGITHGYYGGGGGDDFLMAPRGSDGNPCELINVCGRAASRVDRLDFTFRCCCV